MSGTPARESLVPAWLVTHRRPLVWLVLIATSGMAIAALLLGLATRPGAQPFAPQLPVVFVGSALVIAAYGFVFGLLVLRVPANAVGWVFGLFALVAGITNLGWAYLAFATETVPPRLSGSEIAVVVGAGTVPLWPFLLFTLVMLFPDGRPLGRAWGRLVIVDAVIAVVAALAIVLGGGPLPIWVVASSLALSGGPGEASALLGRALLVALVLLILVAVWSLNLRYRASGDVGRLQLKWLVFAGCVFAACSLVFLLVAGITYAPRSAPSTGAWLLLCFGAITLPLAASVAVFRFRLYEIDTLIGRTLVYGGLTAILAGIYAAAIRLFTWLFEEFTGERSDAALVLTTLVLAATLTPAKSWLEGRVAARRKAGSRPVGETIDDGLLDPADERIARRAAAIVIAELAAPASDGGSMVATADPMEPAEPVGETASIARSDQVALAEDHGRS